MFNSVRASSVAIYLGVLVLLLIAVSGMEAGADEGQAVATGSTSSVASLQVARATPPVAQHDDGQANSTLSALSVKWLQVARVPSFVAEHKEAGDISGPAQDYSASWQNENQPTSQGLDLDTSNQQIGGFYQTADENERNSARVASIASCYEASVGRYNSEVRGPFTNTFSTSAKFDAAMTHFTARKASRLQFETCSKF